jgi:hypothetical protein
MSRMVKASIIGVLLVLLGAGSALADCTYNGKRVREGTRIGVLVCQNGKWVEKH